MMDPRGIEPTFGGGPPPLLPAENLVFATRDPAAVRQAHIRHERQLKSVGLLFGLGAAAMFSSLVFLLYIETTQPRAGTSSLPVVFVFAPMALLLGTLAYGYRRLRPWVKYLGTPVSCLGLLAIPVGTLIHGYILYLLWCDQGRRILQPDYDAIIRSTPEVRYIATTGDKVAMALLILLIVGLVAMALL